MPRPGDTGRRLLHSVVVFSYRTAIRGEPSFFSFHYVLHSEILVFKKNQEFYILLYQILYLKLDYQKVLQNVYKNLIKFLYLRSHHIQFFLHDILMFQFLLEGHFSNKLQSIILSDNTWVTPLLTSTNFKYYISTIKSWHQAS